MRLCTLLLIAFTLATTFLHAQPTRSGDGAGEFCASEILRRQMFSERPASRAEGHDLDMAISDMLDPRTRDHIPAGGSAGGTIYTIPVVVHVIHDGGDENLSDAAIQQGLRNLNDAFRNVGVYDSTTGVDTPIAFCLAQQDEAGRYTTGIDRVRSPLTVDTLELRDLALKNLSRWNPEKYLNIWIVREIVSSASGPSVSGYAASVGLRGTERDGVVIEAFLLSTPDRMKVVVHEMGHYLGLYHTFQGGCENADCLRQGDLIPDTPPDASTAVLPCGTIQNSCTTDTDDHTINNPFRPIALGGLGDQNDMSINYMDYGTTYCQSAFTAGQRDRMIEVLKGPRASLLTSKGCVSTCASPIGISFIPSAFLVNAGVPVAFTNATVGASDYIWLVDGVKSGTARDFSHAFAMQGNHVVKLIASNGDPACATEDSVTIVVVCPIRASFTASDSVVQPNATITFTSTSDPALLRSWFVDGVPIGTRPTIQQNFPTAGGYHVYLVVSNGTCQDTMEMLIRVGDCRNSRRGNVWLFGAGGGVDFNTGIPMMRSTGKVSAREGIATMCDPRGRLICSSNGETVWNRDNEIMDGGDDIGGSSFSAQPCVIVPMPASDSLYYAFTTNNWTDQRTDLRYSVIDMSLNGGRGAVVRKGILLDSLVSERVAAVYHDNCSDIWIVTHEMRNNRFVAFRLTENGVETVPVVSETGWISSGDNRYGGLKFSQDGTHLCSTLGGDINGATVELFDFDKATGKVSNPIVLADLNRSPDAYSSEFSPSGRLLYVSEIRSYRLGQYDLDFKLGVNVSRTDVCFTSTIMSCLQLGPDGRIYIAEPGTHTLGMIPFPNVRGNGCGFLGAQVRLGGGIALQGLPTPIAGYTISSLKVRGPDTVCGDARDVRYFTQGGWCSNGINRWSVSGPASISGAGEDILLNFAGPGAVRLVAESVAECGVLRDTMNIVALPAPHVRLGNDTAICGAGLELDAGAGFSRYLWQDGSTSRTLTATADGVYRVIATTDGGCFSLDSIRVTFDRGASHVDLGRDTALCDGELMVLRAGGPFTSYHWQDGSDAPTFTAYLPGTYWVTAAGACGDSTSDTIVISSRSATRVSIGGERLLGCVPGPVSLTATGGPGGYLWSNGATTATIQVSTPGSYWVLSSNGICSSSDTISVTEGGPGIGEAADLGPDRVIRCTDRDSRLTVSGIGEKFLWSTGDTTSSIAVSSPGIYWVTLYNGRCQTTDTVQVIGESGELYALSLPAVGSAGGIVPGMEIAMPLRMAGNGGIAPHAGIPFACSVRFNGTTLLPIGGSPGSIAGTERRIHITGVTSGTDTLAILRFRAMLGDSIVTAVTPESLEVDAPCLQHPSMIAGRVTMSVCDVGSGPRLIGSGDAAALSVVAPVSGVASPIVDYTLSEHGATRLSLVDLLGRQIMTLFDGAADPGRYRVQLDLAGVPSGVYLLILQTPTQSLSRKLPIHR